MCAHVDVLAHLHLSVGVDGASVWRATACRGTCAFPLASAAHDRKTARGCVAAGACTRVGLTTTLLWGLF